MTQRTIIFIGVGLALIAVVAVSIFAGAWLARLTRHEHQSDPDLAVIRQRAQDRIELVLTGLAASERSVPGAATRPAPQHSPFDEGLWELVGGAGVRGSWAEADEVRSFAVYRDRLFAGVGSPLGTYNAATVWAFNGEAWEKVGGGINDSWPDGSKSRVLVLLGWNDRLYAGIGGPKRGGEVWSFDGSVWKAVGGDSGGGGWDSSAYRFAYTMAILGARLIVGLHAAGASHVPIVLAYDGRNWDIIGGGVAGSWDAAAGYRGVYDLAVHHDHLYASTNGPEPGAGDVWRFDGQTWEQIGGDGLRGSWPPERVMFVESLLPSGDLMLAAVARPLGIASDVPPVWSFDGVRWTPVGENIPGLWAWLDNHNHVVEYGNTLLLPADGKLGMVTLWELANGRRWREVAGTHLGSWISNGVTPAGFLETAWIYRMVEFNGDLYVGFAGHRGAGQVWRYRPAK